MASIFIIAFAITARVLIQFINGSVLINEVLRFFAAGLPLFLIMLGLLDGSGVSTLLAIICFFYFPFVKRRYQNSSV